MLPDHATTDHTTSDPTTYQAWHDHLRLSMIDVWAADTWAPLAPLPHRRNRTPPQLAFCFQSPALQLEFKYAFRQLLEQRQWAPITPQYAKTLERLGAWANAAWADLSSLLAAPLDILKTSLGTYLTPTEATESLSTNAARSHLRVLDKVYQVLDTSYAAYTAQPEQERDVWRVAQLGTPVNLSTRTTHLNFTQLHPVWLRPAAKAYLHWVLDTQHNTIQTADRTLSGLRTFGRFLVARDPTQAPCVLDRALIRDYLIYLASPERRGRRRGCPDVPGLSVNARHNYIKYLQGFLRFCAQMHALPLGPPPLIRRRDYPRTAQILFRAIPAPVLTQLNAHLDLLPLPIQRMVQIVQVVGMRVGDLCTLPPTCLTEDAQSGWLLQYQQHKTDKWLSVPISARLAAVIQAQQQAVWRAWGPAAPYLFPAAEAPSAPSPTSVEALPFQQYAFRKALNDLTRAVPILDGNGQPYHFQPHQFRHTVATRMLNLGRPVAAVQAYLGLSSAEMVRVYAHLERETLRTAVTPFFETFPASQTVPLPPRLLGGPD